MNVSALLAITLLVILRILCRGCRGRERTGEEVMPVDVGRVYTIAYIMSEQ